VAVDWNKVAMPMFRSRAHADVLTKVFNIPSQSMTPALAQIIMSWDFPEPEASRVIELSAKANEGTLTDDEAAELETYVNIGDLLAYWQSKARQALQQA
jgi:hypothetical protein